MGKQRKDCLRRPTDRGNHREIIPQVIQDDPQCAFLKTDGTRCQARRQTESVFCFTHDPDKREQRVEAWKRGGETTASMYKPSLPSLRIEQAQDVVRLVTKTINEVRSGKAHPQVANTIFYGANALIKALELTELQERLENVERLVVERRHYGARK